MPADWFRNEVWNDEIADEFERRLARARVESRAQYLRIQGVHLTRTDDPAARAAGRVLFRRVVDEYPDAWLHTASALEQLGESLYDDGHYPEARDVLRECVRLCQSREEGANGTSGNPGLPLAEALIACGTTEELRQAAEVLARSEQVVTGTPFAETALRYLKACAEAAAGLGRPSAGTFARQALAVADNGVPTFRRYPQFGQVTIGPRTRSVLERISADWPEDLHTESIAQALGIDGAEPLIWGSHDRAHQERRSRADEEDQRLLDALLDAGVEARSLYSIPAGELPRAAPALIAAVTDRSYAPRVRGLAAEALGNRRLRGRWSELVALVRTLDPELDERPRAALIAALADIAGKEQLGDVLGLLSDRSLGKWRGGFLRTLTRLRPPGYWDTLASFRDEPDLRAAVEHHLAAKARRDRAEARAAARARASAGD